MHSPTRPKAKFLLLGLLFLCVATLRPCPGAETPAPQRVSYFGKPAPEGIPDYIFCLRKRPGDPHWYANFGHYAKSSEDKLWADGGSALCKYESSTGKISFLMEDANGTFRDPVVHYDGHKILFSYRKSGEAYFHLYEIDSDGKNLKQITNGEFDDIEACYLPDDRIMFVSTRCKRWVNCWLTRVAVLYRCNPDGSGIEQISANIEHDNTPAVLPNGQVLYTRWEYVDRSQVDFHHLWMMNPDGTRQSVYMGNQTESVPSACLLIDARPIPESNKVLTVYSHGHGETEHAGSLSVINPAMGPDKKESFRSIYQKEPGTNYDPYPFSPTHFTVSKGDHVLLGSFAQDPYISLFEIPETYKGKGFLLFEPRPIQKTKRPHIIPDMVDNNKDYGEMILFNIYEGRNMQDVKKGEVKHLLVLETLPKPINFTGGNEPLSYSGTFTLERIVGLLPVEEDGSVYMKLPKNRSFFFVALDKDMSAIQRMQSFTSVRGGEVISCIGCHEKRTETPTYDNQLHTPLALRKPPVSPVPIAGIPEVMDFPRDIQPILDKHCLKCHNGDSRSGGRNLSGDQGSVYSHSYFSLVSGLQISDGADSWIKRNGSRVIGDSSSELIKKILNRHHDVALNVDEINKIRFWINSGAAYPGTYAALGTGMIGRMYANNADRSITQDPRVAKAAQTIKESCISCHPTLQQTICDEGPLTWWRSRGELHVSGQKPDNYLKEIKFVRHAIYNLTHPEQSALIKAPLSKEAGGYGLCVTKEGKPVMESKDDPRYKILLDAVTASKEKLDQLGHFTRPGFIPDPAYTRELKHYGIIDKNQKDNQPYDTYKADSDYWKSLW